MRELATDRPDRAEDPRTVDAGHFLMENDFLSYAYQSENKNSSSTLNFNHMNWKAGITNNADFQLSVATFQVQKFKSPGGPITEKKGYGNTIARLKYNLMGNDSKNVALGIIPAITLPTAGAKMSTGRAESSLAFLFSVHLPKNWYAKFRTEIFHLRRADNSGWQTNHALVSCFSYSWTEKFSTFFEFYKMSSDYRKLGPYSSLDLGALYLITPDFQLDAGAYVGLTEAAEDYRPYLGLSLRI